MAFDETSGKIILHGGGVGTGPDDWGNGVNGDTWTWNGTVWTKLNVSPTPGARYGHAMAYDPARQRLVLFGGVFHHQQNDTWEWTGYGWTARQPLQSPPARFNHTMAYDAATGRMILIGGRVNNDPWAWDGMNWTPLGAWTPSDDGGRAATDDVRGVIGFLGGDQYWEWDGVQWALRNSGGPPARAYHAMAFDSLRSRFVVFGGYVASDFRIWLGDTWERRLGCRSDLNNDGFVDGIDYDGFMNAFEAGSRLADYNGDCFTDGIDYDQFVNNFESGC